MSIPLPRFPEKTCQRKRRYADEFAARAAGMQTLCANKKQGEIHVYRCSVCRGWHLTSFPVGTAVTSQDPVYEPSFVDEILDLMAEGTITSYFGSTGDSPEMQLIHSTCLEMNQNGLIEQVGYVVGGIVWSKVRMKKSA
jgi:hypothetical protein